jgi:hypothetical protein
VSGERFLNSVQNAPVQEMAVAIASLIEIDTNAFKQRCIIHPYLCVNASKSVAYAQVCFSLSQGKVHDAERKH